MNRDRVNRFAGVLVSIGYTTREIYNIDGLRSFAMHEGNDFNCKIGGYIIIYPIRVSDDDLFLKVLKADMLIEAGELKGTKNHVMLKESDVEDLMANAYDIKMLSKVDFNLEELEEK